jgi:hypothetical protein
MASQGLLQGQAVEAGGAGDEPDGSIYAQVPDDETGYS